MKYIFFLLLLVSNVATAQLTVTATHTPVTCNGGGAGTATAIATGGTAPRTYLWDDGQTTATATGLTAVSHCVTVTDALNATASTCVTVTEPPVLFVNIAVTPVLCFGGNSGTATATPAGGTAPYVIYSWSSITTSNTPVINTLPAGTYTVTVTDINGCTASQSATVTQPTDISIQMNKIDVTCFGGNNGAAQAVATGGASNFTYIWSTNPAQIGGIATILQAGVYTVTATDQNNCIKTNSIAVLQPTIITVQTIPTPVRCFGGQNGSIQAAPNGGTGTFTYLWSDLGAQNTATAIGLRADIYTVVVTDQNNCSVTARDTVKTPEPLVLNTSAVNTRCNASNDGSMSVAVTGGTTPYLYLWNTTPNPNTNASVVGLVEGSYTVIVTDKNNCTASAPTQISSPAAFSNNINLQTVSCKGGSNGSASISNMTGGTAPYTYVWQTTPPQPDAIATGLVAGIYAVSITDINNCNTVQTVTITEPQTSVSATVTTTEVRCNGLSDGTASVVASGGTVTSTTTYIYQWSTAPVIQNTNMAIGLAPNIYTVTVTDASSCSATASGEVREVAPVTAFLVSSTPPTCNNGRDGIANLIGSGGHPPYTFIWATTPPQIGATANNLLGGGTYSVTATDANSCTGSGSITVPNPIPVAVTATANSVACFGTPTGNTTANIIGGVPPYLYIWSGGNATGQTTATATGLTAGNYLVTVTDSKGCSGTALSSVISVSTLNVTAKVDNVLACRDGAIGGISANATGGVTAYKYAWSDASNSTTAAVANLTAGTYTVTVTDANGCSTLATVTLDNPSALVVTPQITNTKCYGYTDGRITLNVAGGATPYIYSYNGGRSFIGNPNLVGVKAAAYPIVVRDALGCEKRDTVFVDEPSELQIDAGADQSVEFGDVATVVAVPSASAGIAYTWVSNPTDTLLKLQNLNTIVVTPKSDTRYFVTIKDAAGCTASTGVWVRVMNMRRVFVATAITPNNDNVNDILLVQGGRGSKTVRYFRVFNRWGEMVYEAKDAPLNDPAFGWDGTYKGQRLTGSVVSWVAEIEYTDGQLQLFKGDVTVL